MQFDWKFWATLAVSFLGIIIPGLLSQLDKKSPSLSFEVVSKTSLENPSAALIPDVEVSFAGNKLEKPTLAVLRIKNDGDTPINKIDYEEPLEITSKNGAKFVHARADLSIESDLKPAITTEPSAIKINPLLLNQGDAINLTLLSSNEIPQYQLRARVAGVSKVNITDQTIHSPAWAGIILNLCAAITGTWFYFCFAILLVRPRTISISRLVCLLIMITWRIQK